MTEVVKEYRHKLVETPGFRSPTYALHTEVGTGLVAFVPDGEQLQHSRSLTESHWFSIPIESG